MKKNLQFLIIIVAIALTGCGKENSDEFIPTGIITGADTNWVSTVASNAPVQELKQMLAIQPKVDSCDANTSSLLHFPDGLHIHVPANAAVLPNGQIATGKINVEALIVMKKGDMIKMDKPTISNGYQLISAGHVFVRLRQNGTDLSLAQGKQLDIRVPDNSGSGLPMLFHGQENNLEKFNWLPVYDSVRYAPQSALYFQAMVNSLRWNGLHTYADTSGQRTNLHVSLAANYTNANTSVYLVYKDVKTVLGVYGNPVSKKFVSEKLPVGKQVTIIVISKQGANSFYFAHQNVTIAGQGLTSQVVLMQPQPKSIPDIKAFLETL